MYEEVAHAEKERDYVGIQMRLPLSGLRPTVSPEYSKEANTKQRWWAFHKLNPHVYDSLVYLTRWLRSELKLDRMSLKLPYEWLRWGYFIHTKGDETYRLNNSFVPYYSRLIMLQEEDLNDIFETRALKERR